MSARYYRLIRRRRGLARYGAQDLRTFDTIWCLTRWGAERWIAMNDDHHFEVLR